MINNKEMVKLMDEAYRMRELALGILEPIEEKAKELDFAMSTQWQWNLNQSMVFRGTTTANLKMVDCLKEM